MYFSSKLLERVYVAYHFVTYQILVDFGQIHASLADIFCQLFNVNKCNLKKSQSLVVLFKATNLDIYVRGVVKTYFNKTQWECCEKSAPKTTDISHSLFHFYDGLTISNTHAHHAPSSMSAHKCHLHSIGWLLCVLMDLVYCFDAGWFCKHSVLWIFRIFTSLKNPASQSTLNILLLLRILHFCFVCVESSRCQAQVSFIIYCLVSLHLIARLCFTKFLINALGSFNVVSAHYSLSNLRALLNQPLTM